MKRFGFLVMVLAAVVLFPMGCGFTKEVRQASALVVPMATYQLTISNTSILWMQDVLKAYKKAQVEAYLKDHPEVPPEEVIVMIRVESDLEGGDSEEVNIDEIIDNLSKIIEGNLEAAHMLDVLNESVQANQGWNPIAGEIENLVRDPEFQALVKAYAELIRKNR